MPIIHLADRVKAIVELLEQGRPIPGLPPTHDIDLLDLLNGLQAGRFVIPSGRGPHTLAWDLPGRPPVVRTVLEITRLGPTHWRLEGLFFLTISQVR